ncbi:hypothetical protein [Paenibacillus xylanivorans]|uniref:Uncharacterized protein n=1 Tax=Paenibacillus xylanivorans TaxID=1705561 RepID=A0A0M9BLD4_9BACL|nr:hypothetical protein [Paenibacillus xylanivorans]KOY14319.1 hypothetical protein AMS66_20170 [Paenibacillus xylanivorans]
MNISFLALIIVGIISIYAIAATLIIKYIGMKFFKDKTNMYFLYASIILVIQAFSVTKTLLSNQVISSFNILFFFMALAFIYQGIKKKRLNIK